MRCVRGRSRTQRRSRSASPPEAPGESPVAVLAERLSALYAQKDALAQSAMERIAKLEKAQAAHDPAALAQRFSGRLDDVRAALEARLVAIEDPAARSAPFAEISEQLTRLYAQKDATTETVLARLAPLEAKLAEIEGRDPRAALDGFAARLEAMQARLDTPAENPFAEISEQLTRLYAQKDATTETVLARLAPLEAKLAEIEGRDPKAALDGFAARLEAMQARLDMPAENPFAEISEQLTRLYAQKDATTETVLARLAPLEAQLAEMRVATRGRRSTASPRGWRRCRPGSTSRRRTPSPRSPSSSPGSTPRRTPPPRPSSPGSRRWRPSSPRSRVATRRRRSTASPRGSTRCSPGSTSRRRTPSRRSPSSSPAFTPRRTPRPRRSSPGWRRWRRSSPRSRARDPRAALDGFATRLEAMQSRLDQPAENPFAEISEQLTRLYAQKDATTETVLARLAPLEAKLAEIEGRDPRAVLDGFGVRLETLQRTQGEVAAGLAALRAVLGDGNVAQPFAAIAEQLTLLQGQRDAGLAALEARLGAMEGHLAGMAQSGAEEAARAEAREIAGQLAALRAAAAQTELFADRLAVLEASLPRLNAAQSQMMRALERQAGAAAATSQGLPAAPEARPEPEAPAARRPPRRRHVQRPPRGAPRPAARRLAAPQVSRLPADRSGIRRNPAASPSRICPSTNPRACLRPCRRQPSA